jgi:YD repeat-containing protein
MSLNRFLRRVFHDPFRFRDQIRAPRKPRPKGRRLLLEVLEDRVVPSLLNLAPEAMPPDIASGARTHLSYTQLGNNANPFHYDAIPLSLTLANGMRFNIANPSGGGMRSTRFDVTLNNSGTVATGVPPGPDFRVTGKVLGGDGTLLTAQVANTQPQNFGFSDTISIADAEFDVRLTITGGQLTGASGPYKVGDDLALLIHQSGLTITKFPATFSYSGSAGSSDTEHIPSRQNCESTRKPLLPADRPPTNDVSPTTPSSPGCGCGTGASSSSTTRPDFGDNVNGYNGSVFERMVFSLWSSRGFDPTITLTYQSDLFYTSCLGFGWEMSGNRRLEVVSAANLSKFQMVFPSAKVGDVDQIDGYGRDDLYVLNNDGSYTDPAGNYSHLVQNADGNFTERFADGTLYTYRKPDDHSVATLSTMSNRDGDTMRLVYDDDEKLVFQYDTLGRPYEFFYNDKDQLTEIRDFVSRSIRFTYDSNGNLASVTTPAVTGTPTGNDFPNGKTTQFTYSSGFANPRLNHELLTITAPNEVADGGPARVQFTYDTTTGSPRLGQVLTQTLGGTNTTNVPAGGTIQYQYTILASPPPGDTTTPARRTTVIDRNGNRAEYEYNRLNNTLDVKEFANRGVRSGDTAFFETQYQYDADYRLTQITLPLGNRIQYGYDSGNVDRFQQGNLLSETRLPDATRGGDQSFITTTYTYEPIYNQVHSMTDPRGNDPNFRPPIILAGETFPDPQRYTTTYTYDYQEGTNFAALGAILGVSAAQAQARLAAAGIPMGLGDVNGDGRTDQIHGDLIRTQAPTVNLLTGSNEATVEGTTQQPIVTLYAYNDFGQMTRMVDPELNVTTYDYYPERDPNGDGTIDNPSGNATTGGYLKQTTEDATSNPGRDSGTNPAPTMIRHVYQYDEVGNKTRDIDGRGIATDYVYNQLNQVVQVVHAAAHNLFPPSPAEPLPLTDFQYLERTFYDFNDNVVLQQVEDRGNTSNVAGPLPPADQPSVPGNFNPAGLAFESTITKYDILDQQVEMVQEVQNGTNPEFLHTRYRYDPNGNSVLTIQPEGNANSAIYDERDLVFHAFHGNPTPPPLVLLAPSDPTNYDVRGGTPCQCTNYRYDLNGNVIEMVDSDDNDLSSANNDPALGPGDRTRYRH